MKENLPESVKEVLREVREQLGGEPGLYRMFENCYTNTLDTTVRQLEDGAVFVITGDIPAMWLRDSSCQLRPYLIPARKDGNLALLLAGLVKRQFRCILTDPYANAFNEKPDGSCYRHDETKMGPLIWERKYETDSLCYPIQTAYLLWKNTGCTAQFDAAFREGAHEILRVFRTEQRHEEESAYRFVRRDAYFTDTLSREGKGALVKSGTGMTWSGFRPSDDACTYGYLIPSNMFATVALSYLETIAEEICRDQELARESGQLSREIFEGIETFGIADTEEFGKIYAYETDGFGQYNLMDDANVPSLLSMRYLGYRGRDEKVAENTRRFVLSDANPYYFKGSAAKGVGSPHTPSGYIWPIALAMEGLTLQDRVKKREILNILKDTDGGKALMHEGFCADDPARYTREWFSWANAMFSELILDYCGFRVAI